MSAYRLALIFRLALALLLAAGFVGSCFADGGKVILQGESSGEILTVFADPAPIRAGQATDISVLVQRALDRQVQLDGTVDVSGCTTARLTHTQATNKVLFSGTIAFPQPGACVLTARHGRAFISGEVRISDAPGDVTQYWPYFVPVPAGILLFTLNRRLERLRQKNVKPHS